VINVGSDTEHMRNIMTIKFTISSATWLHIEWATVHVIDCTDTTVHINPLPLHAYICCSLCESEMTMHWTHKLTIVKPLHWPCPV